MGFLFAIAIETRYISRSSMFETQIQPVAIILPPSRAGTPKTYDETKLSEYHGIICWL
jgi:hypothetical protein